MVHALTVLASSIALLAASRSVAADTPFSLVARQFSGFDPSVIPSQCSDDQSGCRALLDATNSCKEVNCLCTNDVAANMKSCSDCVVKLNVPGYNETTAEISAKTFSDGCQAAGKPITFDGSSNASSDSSGPTSSGSAVTSATASGTSSSSATASAPNSSASTGTQAAGNGATREGLGVACAVALALAAIFNLA